MSHWPSVSNQISKLTSIRNVCSKSLFRVSFQEFNCNDYRSATFKLKPKVDRTTLIFNILDTSIIITGE